MGSFLCCISEILRLLTKSLWPLAEEPSAKEVETESWKVAIREPPPQELVIDILSRLPADSLYQCAKVYKDWNSFFSTHYFIHDLFLPRASPTIIVYHGFGFGGDELFYLDDFGRDVMPSSFKVSDDPCIYGCLEIRFSSFGLLFFTNPYLNYAVVVNPLTCEKTYLFHDCGGHTDICGVYYHPIAKEFFVLLVSQFSGDDYVHFELLRERGPSCSLNRLSSILYLPSTLVPPVNINGALHWMRFYRTPCSHSIVLFSIVEEEFKLMPHPALVPLLNLNGKCKRELHLFDLNGNLALSRIEDVLEIWTLKDYTSWFWTKTHSIKLEGLDNLKRCNFVFVLGTQNGALIINMMGVKIFACDLQPKTSNNFIFHELKGLRRYMKIVCFHTKSLISFRAFQPSLEKVQRIKIAGAVGKSGTRTGAGLPEQIKRLEVPSHNRFLCNFCGKDAVKRGCWCSLGCKSWECNSF